MIKKICVYTTIFDNYDHVSPIHFKTNVDFLLFSDKPINVMGWKNIVIPTQMDGITTNRYFKFKAGSELDGYDITSYIDASIQILEDPYNFILQRIDGFDIYLSKHPKRISYLEEAFNCILVGADFSNKIWSAVDFLRLHNAPIGALYECGFIISNNRSNVVRRFFYEWFELWRHHSIRDQLYAPYLIEKHMLIANIEKFPVYRSGLSWIRLQSHIKKSRKVKKLWRIFNNFSVFIFATVKIYRSQKN